MDHMRISGTENFPRLSGDVPRIQSYIIYILKLIRFARCCTSVFDFHSKNLQIASKLLSQGYRYHKLCKTFGKICQIILRTLIKIWCYTCSRTCNKRNLPPSISGDLVYKLRRARGSTNFIASETKIVKRLRRRQYDQGIIEKTIGLVLGPYTAM